MTAERQLAQEVRRRMADTIRWEEHNRLRVRIEWDGQQYRARCLDYDLVAAGKTLNEARDALWSMIQHYLALTDVQVWNDYYSSVQEAMDGMNDDWATGEHVAN
jgi:hypothetical protein